MKKLPIIVDTILPVLSETKMFRFLKAEEIKNILNHCSLIEFEEKEKIIKENEINDNLYVILENSVSVAVNEKNREVYICTLGEGEFFGEAALFSTVKRTASVSADKPVRLLQINRMNFIRAIKKRPLAGIKILYLIIYSLLKKLRAVNRDLAFERRGESSQDDIDLLFQDFFKEEE